jgi:hypothetical protein
VEKGRWRISEGLCMDRYFVSMGGFGKEIDFKGMNLMGLVHLKRITIQYPLDIFCVVHMMMHIDITVTNGIRFSHFRTDRSRKFFRFLSGGKTIKQVQKMFEYRLNPLRSAALEIEDQPSTLCGPKDLSFRIGDRKMPEGE